jgi:transposase
MDCVVAAVWSSTAQLYTLRNHSRSTRPDKNAGESVQEASRISSRIQKVLEGANVKLASVATNVLGKSGRAMLEDIISGEDDPEHLASLALGHLRVKIPQLRLALEEKIRSHHRFLLRRLVDQIQFVEHEIALLDERLEDIGRQRPELAQAVARWDTIPGIDRVAAWALLAEIGDNMAQFPTAEHLASWAALCPGNHESAGKRLRGTTRPGSPWLCRMACQCAWAATRTKNTYLSSQFRRLAARRGKKRAIIAVAHTIIVIGYHLQKNQSNYEDLGGNYFDRIHSDGLKRYLVKRLQQLGHKVTLEPMEAASPRFPELFSRVVFEGEGRRMQASECDWDFTPTCNMEREGLLDRNTNRLSKASGPDYNSARLDWTASAIPVRRTTELLSRSAGDGTSS